MIIDSHTHIGKKHIVADASQLITSMDEAGIDKCLVFAGKIIEQANNILLQDISPYNGRLYGIGSISLGQTSHSNLDNFSKKVQDTIDYLDEALSQKKIYGLKFYIGYEHYYCYDDFIRPYLELLIKHDKPAIFHSGDCYNGISGAKLKYAHPLSFDDLAVDMPKLKIVIAHMGYPFVREAAEVCYKNKNVYSDCSGFVYGNFKPNDVINFFDMIKEFTKIAAGDKILFGTDWPICNQKDYVLYAQNALKEFDIKQIMGGLASELFGV